MFFIVFFQNAELLKQNACNNSLTHLSWIIKLGNDLIVEIKQIILYFCLGCFLSGCMQSTAMLGPVLTFGGTGNVSQAGVSFFTNKVIEQKTGMDALTLVTKKIDENNTQKSQKRMNKNFILLVKTNFKKTRKKIIIQNQSIKPN